VDGGGEQRLVRVLPRQVHGRGMQQGLAGEEGVDARLGVHALSGPGVVEPGGERHDRGGHREARVAGGEAGRDGVAAAAGVPGERDGRWVFAAVEECAVGVQRVVGAGRERVLGGEPVVQRESLNPVLATRFAVSGSAVSGEPNTLPPP